jgi:Domain of unknown function (DUF4342)
MNMSDTPKPETPIPAQVVDETTSQHQTASDTTNTTNTQHQHKKDTFSSTVDDIFASLRDGFKKINQRQLVLRNKAGQNVLRLPLVWAIVIGLVSFAIQIVPIVIIAVIIALVTKHQFVLEHDGKKPYI